MHGDSLAFQLVFDVRHGGAGEGVDEKSLKLRLDAITKLLPYIKLVEREKLRVRFKNKEAYEEFFASDY